MAQRIIVYSKGSITHKGDAIMKDRQFLFQVWRWIDQAQRVNENANGKKIVALPLNEWEELRAEMLEIINEMDGPVTNEEALEVR